MEEYYRRPLVPGYRERLPTSQRSPRSPNFQDAIPSVKFSANSPQTYNTRRLWRSQETAILRRHPVLTGSSTSRISRSNSLVKQGASWFRSGSKGRTSWINSSPNKRSSVGWGNSTGPGQRRLAPGVVGSGCSCSKIRVSRKLIQLTTVRGGGRGRGTTRCREGH